MKTGIGLFNASVAVPTSLVFDSSAVAQASTVTIPSGALAGYLAILFDVAINSGASSPADVTPAGWTSAALMAASDAAGDYGRVRVSYRILNGTDHGTVVTGMAGTTIQSKIMLVFRGSPIVIPSVTPNSFNSQVANGVDLGPITISANAGIAPLIVVGCIFDENNPPNFSTASPAWDATVADNGTPGIVVLRAGYKIYNSAPASHSIDGSHTAGATNGLVGGYITLP